MRLIKDEKEMSPSEVLYKNFGTDILVGSTEDNKFLFEKLNSLGLYNQLVDGNTMQERVIETLLQGVQYNTAQEAVEQLNDKYDLGIINQGLGDISDLDLSDELGDFNGIEEISEIDGIEGLEVLAEEREILSKKLEPLETPKPIEEKSIVREVQVNSEIDYEKISELISNAMDIKMNTLNNSICASISNVNLKSDNSTLENMVLDLIASVNGIPKSDNSLIEGRLKDLLSCNDLSSEKLEQIISNQQEILERLKTTKVEEVKGEGEEAVKEEVPLTVDKIQLYKEMLPKLSSDVIARATIRVINKGLARKDPLFSKFIVEFMKEV